MGARLIMMLGCLWPFAVGTLAILLLLLTNDLSDSQVEAFLISSFLGAPLVGWWINRSLPIHIAEDKRLLLSVLLTVPVVSAEVCLAVVVFANIAFRLGWGE
jgi:hypothetical protein